jgi:hypothetical protein
MISSRNWNFHSCFIARLTKRVSIRNPLRARHRLRPQDRAIASRTLAVAAIRRV